MNKSRTLLLTAMVFLFFCFLTVNLFKIQVNGHEEYKFYAERQQIQTKVLRGERGFIYDRNGKLLAYNKAAVSFYADRRMLKPEGKKAIAKKLSEVFSGSEAHYLKILNEPGRIAALERRAPKEKLIQLKDFNLDGFFYEEEPYRVYSYDNLASHIIGFVNDKNDGVSGIEKFYDEQLKGTDGLLYIQRDVLGRMITISESETIEPASGESVYLTIDKRYQEILEEELRTAIKEYQSVSALGIIIDPNTGEVLALANEPDYNPNNYSKADDQERRNRILTDTYEPGSTFKAFVMAALLDKDLVNEDEMINVESGSYKIKRTTIRDTKAYEVIPVKKAFEHSSNIAMAKLSTRLNDEAFYKYIRNFGFGNFTFIDIPGEVDGSLKKPDAFNDLTKAFMSFGYEIGVTPLQMAAGYCALVNGGKLYKPILTKKIASGDGDILKENEPELIRRTISEETSNRIRNLLIGVVEEGSGSEAKMENVRIGGKTGTSQQWIANKYSKSNYNSSFVGFFPADDPKAVCLVLLNSPQIGKYGGKAAAPVFKNIVKRLLDAESELARPEDEKPRENNSIKNVLADLSKNDDGLAVNNVSDGSMNKEPRKERINIANKKIMPNLKSYNKREAVGLLSQLGVKYKISGSGKVISQSISPGEIIKSGVVCILKCENQDFGAAVN